MSKRPQETLAPHVAAMIAAAAQPKTPPAAPSRPLAPHVQAAIRPTAQARLERTVPGRPLAPHVQAVLRPTAKPETDSRWVQPRTIQRMQQNLDDLDEYLMEEGFDDLEDDEKNVTTKEDPTFGGKRLVGDSTALAGARYHNKKKLDFQSWKKNREAQHLIPASLHKHYPALEGIVDSWRNGMMLPAVYDIQNKKVTHRKPKHRDHATYTKNVKTLIDAIIKQTALKCNQTTLCMVMDALRPVNKLTQYPYLDDIPTYQFYSAWNQQQGSYQIK